MAKDSPGGVKLEKERFVSFLDGTSLWEIECLTSLVPLLALLAHRAVSAWGFSGYTAGTSKKAALLALEWALLVLPAVLLMTVLADQLFFVTLIASLAAAILILLPSPNQKQGPSHLAPALLHRLCLSDFRAILMLTTCISILAVDFSVFPRRFAKAETYGTGLMDIGVGSFVVVNGISSNHSRGVHKPRWRVCVSVLPLLLLGFARLLSVKGLAYQEHVGEYGVHWNFFFTIAAVTLFSSLLPSPSLSSPASATRLGLALLSAHQITLSAIGLSPFIMQHQRSTHSLLSLNKEGIFSLPGYFALYALSVALGQFLAAHQSSVQSGPNAEGAIINNGGYCGAAAIERSAVKAGTAEEEEGSINKKGAPAASPYAPPHVPTHAPHGAPQQSLQGSSGWIRMSLVAGLLWIITLLLHSCVERVSRRACNAAYVFWILASCTKVILIFRIFHSSSTHPFQLLSMRLLDRNLLPTFLIANLATGVVNMSVDTLHTPPSTALTLILCYTAIVFFVMFVSCEVAKVKLKIW